MKEYQEDFLKKLCKKYLEKLLGEPLSEFLEIEDFFQTNSWEKNFEKNLEEFSESNP